ncbi:ubiquitin-protein ligase peroxin 12 [Ceratocystis pirilliformis]|uniref:Peroxisome assembly protein 12 n=1 Tax=Ceratocystis pirilliformis TaxID=259994 RepID=A0ABR3ZH28_9PEZI
MEFVTALRGQFDPQKPSLFELLSEQQLSALLPPTLRYLLVLCAQRYPRYFLRLLNSFDEAYALAMVVVERFYLRTRGGSFTENFYGLKREKATATDIPRAMLGAAGVARDTLRLQARDIWANIAVSVGAPYLKRRLDEDYEINAPRALLGLAYTRMPCNPTLRQRFVHYYRWFLRNVYPSANAAYGFATLAFNLAYLFDRSRYHSPLMWLVGTRVRRMAAADYQALEQKAAAASAAALAASGAGADTAMWQNIRRTLTSPRRMGQSVLAGLSMALPASIFALKFLEWWYASDFAKQLTRNATDALELPPPVLPVVRRFRALNSRKSMEEARKTSGSYDRPTEDDAGADEEARDRPSVDEAPVARDSLLPIFTVPAPKNSALCPICEEQVQTATACQTGIVYCYSCIHRWLEGEHQRQEAFMLGDGGRQGKWENGKGRCPVTGRRVLGSTDGLRRIMI